MTLSRAWKHLPMFRSLHNRHFRWFWVGRLASSATMQMGSVAQGWLVYELTGSAFALGWVSAGWSVATTFLSLYGGVISDRLEKKALLVWTRVFMVVNTLAIVALILSGVIQVWHLAISSLLNGVLFAIMMPAQNAYLSELVDRRTLLNAVSLNSVGMGLAGIFSASLAGFVIELVGVQGVYLLMAGLYGVVIWALARLPNTGRTDPNGRSAWSDLCAGVRYLRVCPILVPLLGMVFARGLFAMPYSTFMPKYAEDVMGLDAAGYGMLASAPGVGGLISSLVLASLGDYRGKGRILLVAVMAMGVSLVLFSQTRSLAVALALLAVVGAASNACMVANQTLVQVSCEDAYRGRVMSMYMMMFGVTQLGTIPAGAIADQVGVAWVIGAQGVLFALVGVSMFFLQPRVRRLD
jgi:MFS family permease